MQQIITKESVLFYDECWVERLKIMYDEEEQMKRLSQWYVNVLNEMANGEIEARRYVERTKLNIDRALNESIRSWTLGALKIKRKLKKYLQNDITIFFNV